MILTPTTTRRFVHLECARGIASIIVLLHHFALAFYLFLKGNIRDGGLQDTPLYILINGQGAVIFFFVLSGFVLTLGMYEKPSRKTLAVSVIKRLPRLMLPASLSILLGYLILKYGGTPYLTAGKICRSDWLQTFAYAYPSGNTGPAFAGAIRESLLILLVPYHSWYNSNLWTMVHEFRGSLLVFGIVFIYCAPRLRSFAVMAGVHIILLLLCYLYYYYAVAFIGGSWLAYVSAKRRNEIRLPSVATVLLLTGALVGFSISNGPYDISPSYSNMIASLMLMTVLVFNDSARRVLSGRFAAFLGQISFPIYLVSTLMILSASSSLFLYLTHHGIAGIARFLILLPATLVISLLACLPLLIIDSYWVKWLNKSVKIVVFQLWPVKNRRMG